MCISYHHDLQLLSPVQDPYTFQFCSFLFTNTLLQVANWGVRMDVIDVLISIQFLNYNLERQMIRFEYESEVRMYICGIEPEGDLPSFES